MLLEYADYGTLKKQLRVVGEFELTKLLEFFYKIVESVCYCHQKQIVHRDIKPENILIDSNFEPKLADFGTVGDVTKI